MKTIKEKTLIIQPKAADVARRIPQGIKCAAELGHSQTDHTEQDQEDNKPENQVVDGVQQSTFHATDLLASKFKRSQAKSKNPFQTNRIQSNRVSFSRKPGVSTIRPKQNVLHPLAKSAQIKSAHFLQSQKFASKSMAKMTRSVSQKIVLSIKSFVAGLRSIGAVFAAGGWAAVALVIFLALIGWIMTTPAGIFSAEVTKMTPVARSIPSSMSWPKRLMTESMKSSKNTGTVVIFLSNMWTEMKILWSRSALWC